MKKNDIDAVASRYSLTAALEGPEELKNATSLNGNV